MSEVAVRASDWRSDLPSLERTPADRVFDRARWVLIVAWLLVFACFPILGERNSSWAHLRHAASSGAVTHVEVNGEHVSGNGFSTVDLHWREHGLRYRAEVVQLFGDQGESDCQNDDACSDPAGTKLDSPPSELLQALQPGLAVKRTSEHHLGGDSVLGFDMPGYMLLIQLLLGLATLGVLISGPQTWWATKWAWFWWLSNPLGVTAFLLFSGPTRPIPPPRDPSRRLTGGWSFLLHAVVSSVAITIGSLTL